MSSGPETAISRRRLLLKVVGAGAVIGGAGLAWWIEQRQPNAVPESETALWQQQFTQVDGSALAMAAFKGRPLVLNFWATWCPPCVEELPLLDGFFRENKAKSWQVVGLAVDQLAPVKRFLTQSPLSFPVALAGFSGVELSRSLGNLSGGLPFTVVFGPAGEVLHRKMGKVSPDDLRVWGHLYK